MIENKGVTRPIRFSDLLLDVKNANRGTKRGAVRDGKTGHWQGDRKQTTVWEIQSLNPTGGTKEERVGHGTQKPVECMRRPIVNNSSAGQGVYDPFLGSGSTLIACETEGRACYGMELEPAYCDMVITRWEAATGHKAVKLG